MVLRWSDEDGAYVATSPEFPGLSAFGGSPEAAVSELRTVLGLAIETYEAEGWKLPDPRRARTFSGQFRLRLPRSLHGDLVAHADSEGVSLNTLLVSWISERLGRVPEGPVAPRG